MKNIFMQKYFVSIELKMIALIAVIIVVKGCSPLIDGDVTIVKGSVEPSTLNTGLPIITIDTEGRKTITSKENYLRAAITIVDAEHPGDADYNLEVPLTVDADGAGIRGRGHSTWVNPKKPYRIKFDKKQKVLGISKKAKSWVLLAEAQDPTLLANSIAFELGKKFEFPFTNSYKHIELVLNGRYEGCYVLTEQVQVGEGRVDIDAHKGFLVELDNNYDEEPKFTTEHYNLPVMIKSPEDLADTAGYDFVKDNINALEAKLKAEDFPTNGYRDLIDLNSFIDYIMINEILCNGDIVGPRSVYLHKDVGKKISMGPLWDFDRGFGFYAQTLPWQNLILDGYRSWGRDYFNDAGRMLGHDLFVHLFDDPEFEAAYKARWNAKKTDIESIVPFIDAMAEKLNASQAANFTVWQWNDGKIFQEEIEKMKAWYIKRVEYLNTEINRH
jgi:hypothetical protein